MSTWRMYMGGKWVEPAEGGYFDAVNPATGEVIGKVAEGSRTDARAAIAAARQGAEQIAAMSVWDRSRLLRSIADVLEARKADLAHVVTRDQGKPYYAEALSEIEATVLAFSEAAEQIKWLETSVIPVEEKHKKVFTIRQPKGVYGIITPWNFPVLMPGEYLAYALAAGNAVVWVPAPSTSVCAVKLLECLEAAGVPGGVVNGVTGHGAIVGDEIVANPGTDAIAFTGSTATGRQIATRGAGKPLLLELGGNGPTIVLDDADLDHAAQAIAANCFYNAGQVCSSTELILAHRDIRDGLAERLVKHAKEIVLGDPFAENTTMGPLNNEQVAAKNDLHARDSVQNGASILTGGARAANQPSALFFEPTVIVDVTEACLYSQEETFGPVAPIVSFTHRDDALAMASRNKWGLVSSVFTADVKQGMYFAEKIKAGIVNINDSSPGGAHVPFGGVAGKGSGVGRIGGKHAILEMTDLKTIALDLR